MTKFGGIRSFVILELVGVLMFLGSIITIFTMIITGCRVFSFHEIILIFWMSVTIIVVCDGEIRSIESESSSEDKEC